MYDIIYHVFCILYDIITGELVWRKEEIIMSTSTVLTSALERRRRELGMSRAVVARRSGLSLPTVQRILSGGGETAAFVNVLAIANALGIRLEVRAEDADEILERQAREKARHLVALVQGSAGLEGQAVDERSLKQMERRTVHELRAGSKRRLWGD